MSTAKSEVQQLLPDDCSLTESIMKFTTILLVALLSFSVSTPATD